VTAETSGLSLTPLKIEEQAVQLMSDRFWDYPSQNKQWKLRKDFRLKGPTVQLIFVARGRK
jgi:hypothetical protein